MATPSVTDWISACSTVVAVVAAGFAAFYTRRAATEAAKAARAAADQVELQRPRPIVIAAFLRSLSETKVPGASDTYIRLRNIGDSPAFDVLVSPLETPGVVPGLDSVSRLETERVLWLAPGIDPVPCVHRVIPDRGPLSGMRNAAGFVDDAKTFFDMQSRDTSSRSGDHRYEIKFAVSYRSLDGRRFEQCHLFVVHFTRLSAWVEPVGSLLEAAVRNY